MRRKSDSHLIGGRPCWPSSFACANGSSLQKDSSPPSNAKPLVVLHVQSGRILVIALEEHGEAHARSTAEASEKRNPSDELSPGPLGSAVQKATLKRKTDQSPAGRGGRFE